MTDALVIDLIVAAPDGGPPVRRGEPVRFGVPVVPGRCFSDTRFRLQGGSVASPVVQSRVLDLWPDGSARWILFDLLLDHDTAAPTTLSLVPTDGERPGPSTPCVRVASAGTALVVETGAATFTLPGRGSMLFSAIEVGGHPAVDPSSTGLRIERTVGGAMPVHFGDVVVEERGPLRATIRLDGMAGDEREPERLDIRIRLHFAAGSTAVRFDIRLQNPRAATHPGGFWELGEPAATILADVSLELRLPASADAATVSCSPEVGSTLVESPVLELFQASSGGAQWNSRNHVDRHGHVPLAFQGYRFSSGEHVQEGLRATPVVRVQHRTGALAVTMSEFWQNFPKAIQADARGLRLGLFPREHGSGHELQPGEQRTHSVVVAFGADETSEVPLDWARTPLLVAATPSQYCESGAVPYLLPLSQEPDPGYAALVAAAVDGDDGFVSKRESVDEYGWRHYGDLYADHERVYYAGPAPVISHYNNQYDAISGFARQFMRSADPRWWELLSTLARHVVDIDIYHTDGDKAAYSGGLFWHTAHYADAGRSTHRSYPRADGVPGGGPSAEHNFTGGLLLHYFLTGDVESRDAAIGLARWVLAMDDGSRTVFRWLAGGCTGLATATREPDHQGPGRGAAYSIAALLDGHRLTGESLFLEKAEALIRRCIHPDDRIDERRLLDIEQRWSYTIFLHVLGRYLDLKVERGEVDPMYTYGRQALLAYARWMAQHERPYFDRREELEFPTETWLAQELWKSEVFVFAARFAAAEERQRYLERAAFFHHYAIRMLQAEPTRTLTRPLVLLLSRGLMHGHVERHPEVLGAPTGGTWNPVPPPASFVTQKARAKRRARALAVGGAGALVVGGALWLLG